MVSGEAAPEQIDIAAIRFGPDGLDRLEAIERAADAAYLPPGLGREPFTPVDVDCRWIAVREGVEAARLAPSPQAHDAARVRAEALTAERARAAESAAREASGDGAASALLAATARDSVWTALWYDQPRRTPEQRFDFELVETLAARPRCEARQSAIEALDALLAYDGWPDLSAGDDRLAAAITLTIQHAGRRRGLREQTLRWLEAGLEARRPAAARRYALVADRLAVLDGEAQPYGTQGGCDGGAWRRLPLADEAAAEVFRARHGLESLAAHAARMQAACR